MNKILKGLLLTALTVSAAQLQAETNKTFMMPRPVGVNLAMEYTTWNELVHRKDNNKFGANFQVTGFYQASTNADRVGRYFGINDKSTINLNYEAKRPGTINPVGGDVTLPGTPCTASTVTCDMDLGYILHDAIGVLQGQSVILNFDPKQKAYGARFDYYQDLEKIVKGLYLTVALPVVHVENDMGLSIDCAPACNPCSGTVTTPNAALNQRVINYFKGCTDVSLDQINNKQVPLAKAKIDGRRGKTGVADIDVKLGYNFLDKENYHLGLNLGVTFPTGNEAKGNYVFEPIVGNGQHWGLGFGLDSLFRIWNNEDSDLKFAVIFNYRYLFKNDECRTLGINGATTASTNPCAPCGDDDDCAPALNWGQYRLLGDNTITTVPYALTPAANITTLNVNVTPGSQFDGIAALTYNNSGWSLDLGYNLYLRAREKVSLKGNCCETPCATPCTTTCPTTSSCSPCKPACDTGCASSIAANRYGIASRGFATGRLGGVPFAGSTVPTTQGQDFDGCTTAFLACPPACKPACSPCGTTPSTTPNTLGTLNTCVAQTPSQISNKIFAGVGYIFKEWDYPLMLGATGSYEWANDAALDQWLVGAKIGIGF